MEQIIGLTRGGTQWTPSFVTDLNQETCIGCGRCYKVCPRDVFELVERGSDDDEDFSDEPTMVMAINDPMDCIGCKACSKVCPKSCHSHTPQAA
jgi:Nif-specific ferredoxin III